jgi:hypothetical protein
MTWYYAVNGQQIGPVAEAEFQDLVTAGTIKADTMVWRDGLPAWQPYGTVGGSATPAPPIVSSPSAALDLRPMGIGDILDRTFRLYRSHFMPFFLIMLAVQAIAFLTSLAWRVAFASGVGTAYRGGSTAAAFGPSFFIGFPLLMIIVIVLNQIGIATLTAAVSSAYLQQQVSVRQAYLAVRDKLGRLIGAALLTSLLILLGLMLCLVPGVYFMLSYMLVSEVVVLENLGPITAMRRSKELMRVKTDKGFVRNNITKASVILLITLILGAVVGAVVTIPFAIARTASRHPELAALDVMSPLTILQGVLTAMVQAAVAPIGRIAMVLFYYDIRIRKEGFDLEVLAAALGSKTPTSGTR